MRRLYWSRLLVFAGWGLFVGSTTRITGTPIWAGALVLIAGFLVLQVLLGRVEQRRGY